jgi:hypothetical protein
MSMPDKIHAFEPTTFDEMDVWQTAPHESATEYTRSDLIPTLIAEEVAREREACAQFADACQRQNARRAMDDKYYRGVEAGAQAIAAAIRARGNGE